MEENHTVHDAKSKEIIKTDVEKYGCHLALFEADNHLPAFSYSIGLYKTYQHPEIVCFGLNHDVMKNILNHAASQTKLGEVFSVGQSYSGFLEGYDVQFLEVSKEFYPYYFGYAGWYYDGYDFPVLQLIWPDKSGCYPHRTDFNPDWKFYQPLLDRNTDFLFYEERNLGVYTTKQVLDGEPILYVYHNADGDWQFHSSIDPDINEAKLVCLSEIVKLDPSVNELYDLQYGWSAWRENIDSEWEYGEDQDEENE